MIWCLLRTNNALFFGKAPFLVNPRACFQIVFFNHVVLVLSCTLLSPGMGPGWVSPCDAGTPLSDSVLPPMGPRAALWQVKARLELPVCYVVSEQGSLAISLVQAVARFLLCFLKSESKWG